MNQLVEVIAPALFALVGTILGLWLGHRRWSSELRMTSRRAFDSRRHAAYEELWNILESAHIAIRTGRPDESDVRKLKQQINSFRLRNAILLDPVDSVLALEYFDSILRFSTVIAESGSRELAEQLDATSPARPALHMRELVDANKAVERMREELIGRVRAVLLETSYAAKSV